MANAPAPRDSVCLILAAGLGRRMGGPKALMEVGGQPWWLRQAVSLAAMGMPALWVVNERVEAGIAGHPDAPRSRLVSDGEAPMFDSLMAGLRRLEFRAGFVHVLPVDVPCPRRETFASLEAAAGDGVAVPMRAARRGHPVCLSHAWIAHHLRDETHAPETRLDSLIRGWTTDVETPDDPDTTFNLNTPEDVRAWLDSRSARHD